MITLKKLIWDNCFSYGEKNILELDEHTLTQIVGTNGVGKSSIPLIIEEALYNKNSKGIKKADLPNRYSGDQYKIFLELTKDDSIYSIDIARKGASIKVKLVKNGEDISSHTATNTFKTIQEEILGIDFKTFTQLVYQNTNNSLQFLTATDTVRKKFLIDLLGLEDYVAYFDVFKNAVKELSTEATQLEGSIDTITNWLNKNKLENDVEILPTLSLPDVPKQLESESEKLKLELNNISSTNKRIKRNNEVKDLLAKIDINKINSIDAYEIKNAQEQQKELGQATANLNAAQKVITKMESLHGVCPTCAQNIDESKNLELINASKEIIENANNKIQAIKKEIASIELNNKKYEEKQRKQKEFEDLLRSVDRTLPSEFVHADDLTKRLNELTEEIESINKNIRVVAAKNQEAEKHNTRIQIITEQTNKFKEDLEKACTKLEKVASKLGNLEVLKKAFSTNGLLAYKIENLVKELEEITNSYLAELADGRFTIEFVVNNDKLNVEITDNGNVVDILALSSGELARVNTATLLAIRKLMSSISKTKINILFLDEVINVLDEQGREKLVEVLIKEEDLNTYLVSHGWTHPLLNKVDVIKKNNISFLEN
jgi:DNA repair exonuclease SbcCD ATPase subunit